MGSLRESFKQRSVIIGCSFRTVSFESQQKREEEEERLKDCRLLQKPLQASKSGVLVLGWWVFAEKALYATSGS